MSKKLLIVESPSKAKTISKYLGSEYKVVASVGHIRDLPKSNKKAIDIEAGFVPHYEIVKGKEKIIDEIRKLAKGVNEIILATDPDREGEAIAWHVTQIVDGKNKKLRIKRARYYEITEEAIKEALSNLTEIDLDLKTAQEARRVLDRLVGYDLSGLIWKKVRYGLSAGRVQSPALRIIMEREREIRAFKPEKFWTISGEFETEKKKKLALTCEKEPRDQKETEGIIKEARDGKWNVVDIRETETKRSPRPPFTTSTLQQSASSRLGFSPSRTMSVAQRLYEAGLITYMRTDSTTLSPMAKKQIAVVVEKKFGRDYVDIRDYKTKSKNAQEAHESIRPTDFSREVAGQTDEQKKLYKLIWQRVVSSQMAYAKIFRTKISANIESASIPNFSANGSRITFDGWLAADKAARGEDVELPEVYREENLKLLDVSSEEKESVPPSHYTEAGLIKELEKRGIGRPSTYASIIKTLLDRGYVTKLDRSLAPTDTGDVVSSFLEENFAKYISDTFTAEMENELDEIATGKRDYEKTLRDFYKPFSSDVTNKNNDAKKITNLGKADKKWKCPICGGEMIIKLGRTGKFLSCEKFPKCRGARTIVGDILDGPKDTGEICPECGKGNLVERDGRFGRFIACSRYPRCKYIKKNPEDEKRARTGIGCPVCGEGEMVEKRGRFGIFYSCSNYPKCKNAIKAKPTGKICELCGSLMMAGTKTIPERCSNNKCLNHRPDKLAKK